MEIIVPLVYASDVFFRKPQAEQDAALARLRVWQREEWRKRKEEERKNAGYHSRLRNARMKTNGGSHTKEQAAAILEAQNWLCVLCDADLKIVRKEKDHIRPVAKGGSDDIANIQWLCRRCNCRKNDSWTPSR